MTAATLLSLDDTTLAKLAKWAIYVNGQWMLTERQLAHAGVPLPPDGQNNLVRIDEFSFAPGLMGVIRRAYEDRITADRKLRRYTATSQLLDAGWTQRTIANLIGQPDKLTDNPYSSKSQIKLYDCQRVERIQQDPAVQATLRKTNLKRNKTNAQHPLSYPIWPDLAEHMDIVDPGIRDLIRTLNECKYITTASCQGIGGPSDRERSHDCHAYVSFRNLLPSLIYDAAATEGLCCIEANVIRSGCAYSHYKPERRITNGETEDPRESVIYHDAAIANRLFVERITRAFQI